MTVTIRLMSDWTLSPHYVDEGDGFFALTDAETLAERFALPPAVGTTIGAWNRLYEDNLTWDGIPTARWTDEQAHRRYLDAGRAAARLLRRHVPADVEIEYLADESVEEHY